MAKVSRVLEYKVGETIHPVNNWIKYIKEKGGKANKGDEGFSKEIKKNDEVNVVQKCTKTANCEVRCKAHSHVGTGAVCTVHGVGVYGNMHEQCEKFHLVVKKKDGQTSKTHRSG